MKKISLIIFLLFFCFCKENHSLLRDKKYDQDVVVYKFLYNYDYGIPINEKSFWAAGKENNEFAIHNMNLINEKDMLSFISSLEKTEIMNEKEETQFSYYYAFVFPSKDTIYSNSLLNEWIVVIGGKKRFYKGPYLNNSNAETGFYNVFLQDSFFDRK